jgi:protein SCO1/2
MSNWKYNLGFAILLAAASVAGVPQLLAQASPPPGFADPDIGADGPTVTRGQKAPALDMLNMKGGDRPVSLKEVTIEQRLNSQLPLDAEFRDETGKTVPLGSFFGKRPVVLALVYYDCPMLCTQILNGMVRAAKVLTFAPGKEYDVVAISFDARETAKLAAEKKAVYVKRYGHPETADGWHFLTGDVNSIKRVTEAVGFRYVWDVHTAQFAHASAIYVLTPQGRLSKYFYGIDYSPKDMRLGLIEASNNRIGNPVDQIMLFCYHFDPHAAKYTVFALGLLRVAGAATVLTLGGFVFIMLRRESRQKGSQAA